MESLWRGSWTTRARVISGVVLFVYVLLHFLNIGLGVFSPQIVDLVQDWRVAVTRSIPGTALLYGALLVHAGLAFGKIAFSSKLRLTLIDVIQVGFGVAIPLLLASHVVFTRGGAEQFGTDDTIGYIAGLIWATTDGWEQAILLLITWVHGCLGLHMWLSATEFWRRSTAWLMALAALVPAFALAGFMTEGRRVKAILTGNEETRSAFLTAIDFPPPSGIAALNAQIAGVFWTIVGLLFALILIYAARQIRRPGGRIEIDYVDGPTVRTRPGSTLLDISRDAGVPHMSLCGGRGRCTTCRVIIEDSAGELPAPSEAETRALRAVKAQYGARLACQMRPETSIRVYKVFETEGNQTRDHASQGKEADLAILFLDMRGFTARTAGQLPYDVVFLLNRFFDAIVPAIQDAGGTIDKYMGDGLLAVFETEDAASSARAALKATSGVETALFAFNAKLALEDGAPLEIGIGLHLGGLVIGDIGARGQSSRTLIGDSVNTASRLEAKTKELGARILVSEPLLHAAGQHIDPNDLQTLSLRGVDAPLRALPVPYTKRLLNVLPEAAPKGPT